jgi:signal transduction histidine kinase/ActR/RegA family two-component response regulator
MVLAAAATLEWPGWSYAWLVLATGIFSLSGGRGDGRRGEAEAAAARTAEDAARIRELQDTVEELTRLRAAALEASQRRDEFLATISHELRSPLNVILGWTQVLEPRPELPADVRDALGVIRRNALRQRQLLDDLVDMSRVVSGALRVEPRPMRIQDALDEACQAIGPSAERKGIRLDCGPASDAIVAGDASRLQHVLRTLLANAIGATPAGGAISLRTAVIGPEVSIAVTDTGAGIDAAALPQVFEPFRRLPGAAPRDPATSGLDLALARIIVVGHGGRIQAHSDGPGRGSTFTVRLPAAATQTAAAGIAAEPSEPSPTGQLAGLRVLAVDDEADWRELLGHILGAAGADARIAASAAEAIQIFEGWRPDVVLTDIAMPVTDGYGLLGAIRGRGGAGRAVPAIAMTAHAGAQERSRTAAAGFAEHLAKPIPPHELVDAVRRVGEQSSRTRGAGAV